MIDLGKLGKPKMKPLEDDQRTRVWLLNVACDADICLWSDIAKDVRSKITIDMATETYERSQKAH